MDLASALLPIGGLMLGATCTFFAQRSLDRAKHAQQEHLDREARVQERRADAYVDLLAAIDLRMSRVRLAMDGVPPAQEWFGEAEGNEQLLLKARVSAFGSHDVQQAMRVWTNTHQDFWRVAILAAADEGTRHMAQSQSDVLAAAEKLTQRADDLRQLAWTELNPGE